ncbi:hypothetical protein CJ030_MR5G027210 [Morella rubra]|uniref:Uncharacterized protein n=1 Tax=Morella rubra TaxID=262757 RepID=A0A6A1VND9_9ROSI|nr:hypothetical protein CJ030_MR5G027210 [Morella rubra]
MDHRNSAGSEGIISVRIDETYGSCARTSEPNGGIEKRGSGVPTESTDSIVSPRRPIVPAPEKKLTLFALRLAVLEKAATGLGTLAFLWATVVLLGGFAVVLENKDFWYITIILVIEGTRLFSRSRELEWQHQATRSITDSGINSFRAVMRSSSNCFNRTVGAIFRPSLSQKKRSQHTRELTETHDAASLGSSDFHRKPSRTWKSTDVPFLPFHRWIFLSRNVSRLLYWLQLLSAIACVVLSLMRLIKHDYGQVGNDSDADAKRNRKPALFIFYSLAMAEATLFLMERVFWEWRVRFCRLLDHVNEECELGASGMVAIRRFFYDAYSRCVTESIFDGLQMDLFTFATDLLASNSPDEQLIGVRILQKFSLSTQFSNETLQKMGINLSVIERLVEMLNWTDPMDEEIRRSAAEILSKLAGKKQNSLRIAGVAGAMESISSLLQRKRSSISEADEISEKETIDDHANYDFWTFNDLGLRILKKLARHDHDTCGRIGNTRGLLSRIIDFSHAEERLLKDKNVAASQIKIVKRSLQVVKMLAATTGSTGKLLRKEISEMVFTISNIRHILRYGEMYPKLQKQGIDILTSLAQDVDATERIGNTGGVLKYLFNIFFTGGTPEDPNKVRTAAGDALAYLALESENNCHRILKLRELERLVRALEDPLLRIKAARILRHLCTYSTADFSDHLKGVTAATPTVIRAIVLEENRLQEVMLGLAARSFNLMTPEESSINFKRAKVTETELATVLVQILDKHQYPPVKFPKIRRFSIELAIWMMRDNKTDVRIFKDLEMERVLENVLETTAELESFNIVSGAVGLNRHRNTIHSLVETALRMLEVAGKGKTR